MGVVMAFLLTGNVLAAEPAMTAETEELKQFTLDQVVVTATRDSRRDVDIPASTEVLTREDIRKTGGQNLAMVLRKVPGFTFKSFGQSGASMGTMTNEAIIRGVDNGTLVLLNGNPINWRGKYNLEAVSAEDIERVEIVKGGGSVLYGSEGMGGVINIITRKGRANFVKVGVGNFGRKIMGSAPARTNSRFPTIGKMGSHSGPHFGIGSGRNPDCRENENFHAGCEPGECGRQL